MLFIWIGKKGFMRGPVWFLFLLGSFAGIIGGVILLVDEGIGDGGSIILAVLSVLYIAAYFILPKKIMPAAPLATVPEANTALSIPARLTIVRDGSAVAALVPTIITLNGQQVCSLKNGGSAQITLTMRHNILLTNSVGSKNVRYAFEARDGAMGELHVKGGVFQVKTVRWS